IRILSGHPYLAIVREREPWRKNADDGDRSVRNPEFQIVEVARSMQTSLPVRMTDKRGCSCPKLQIFRSEQSSDYWLNYHDREEVFRYMRHVDAIRYFASRDYGLNRVHLGHAVERTCVGAHVFKIRVCESSVAALGICLPNLHDAVRSVVGQRA